jgi:molybdopterin synthase sulfur carrier subunit
MGSGEVIMRVSVRYFASLREQAAKEKEDMSISGKTLSELYDELSAKYGFTLEARRVKVAVNDEFAAWDRVLSDGDTVVFIPPVAGG